MGAVLEQSGIGRRVCEGMKIWVGRLPGGLSLATMGMCTLFAAGTGVVGAVEVMVGLLVIGPMVKANYSRGLISGTICAGGSLGARKSVGEGKSVSVRVDLGGRRHIKKKKNRKKK